MKVKEILEICQPVWKDNDKILNKKPVVSVLLPTYRRAKSGLFEKCVKSVLGQTYSDIELLIIDDASTDGTEEIIKKYMEQDARVKCIRHTYNVGLPAISEYEGFVRAKGDIIAFIFDDCIWELDYLEKIIGFMSASNKVDCCYSKVRFFYGKKPEEFVIVGGSSEHAGTNCLPSYNFIPNSGIVVRRSILEDKRCGLYDPHLAMTRLCDWALWKRIDNYYNLYETGLIAGSEYGVSSKDSLGNTYDMHLYSALEREVESYDMCFAPNNFGEIEIDYCSENASESYIEAIHSLKESFKEKKWYRNEPTIAVKESRKIIYILGEITATLQISLLAFARSEKSHNYLFRFAGASYNLGDMMQSDAVICVRNQLHGGVDWLTLCSEYNIPVFYFTDDNFEVLAKNYSDQFIADESSRWTKERLESFDGIIVMSNNLKKYFVEKKNVSPNKVYTIPGMSAERIVSKNKEDETITLVFMGGSWRNACFISDMYPEIRNLAVKYNVRLVLSDDDELKDINDDGIEIVRLKRRLNLAELLREIRSYSPDYWLHCGYGQPNDIYKNPNALWNALSVGAELIVNEINPYMEKDLEDCIHVIKNPREIMGIIEKKESVNNSIYEKALAYYEANHSDVINYEAYENIFKNVDNCDRYELARRFERYILSGATEKATADGGIITRREIDSNLLRLSKLTDSNKRYYLSCPKDKISSISVIFTSYEEEVYDGYIILELLYKGHMIRSASVNMKEIRNNQWADFCFEPLEGLLGKSIEVNIRFLFNGEKKKYGVYEFAPNMAITYRILNKIGIKSKYENVLFFDVM